MRNVNSPSDAKRKLLAGVVISILTYGVKIWGEAVKFGIARKYLEAVHRAIALRLARAYRTVSSEALAVISGFPLQDLTIASKLKVARGIPAAEAEEELSSTWQRRWEESSRGRWTFSLIPEVEV